MAPKTKKQSNANCYDKELRDVIAWRIFDARNTKFPGHGGAKKCAKLFGVSDQQWSQYENARRTPDDEILANIARLFGVSIDLLKTAPDDWPEKRRQWKTRPRPGRRSVKVDSLDSPEEGDRNPDETVAVFADGMDVQQEDVGVVDLIEKLIKVQKMHQRGEIPTSLYRKGMETVDSIITLSFGGKA